MDQENAITADLIAVLVAVSGNRPRTLTVKDGNALPSGPFEADHRSLQSGLRARVERQTGHVLGYIEQLYTFADRDRAGDAQHRVISISYLGLTREGRDAGATSSWRDWYDYFPWEDHRDGRPPFFDDRIAVPLLTWARDGATAGLREERTQRVNISFGLSGLAWHEELVLQRYELLYEAGLVPSTGPASGSAALVPGKSMLADHRRILATGIGRLRAKIKYRPVVFELLAPTFTLLQLQRCVEALAGQRIHKQNFRRLIEQQELVEETGAVTSDTIGRPAKLFRFRQAVLAERVAVGTKIPLARG
ncbi:NUDIX hydrolase [Labrys miyagiensis]|uniref:NUDIX hydrolase n=1 Tax=Labrys miyagiensis TaxID=346912 RepID=UPI0024E0947D|nr:hypothetical protein [Labrys miyagiensis]